MSIKTKSPPTQRAGGLFPAVTEPIRRRGFEPLISSVRGRCPRPLDERRAKRQGTNIPRCARFGKLNTMKSAPFWILDAFSGEAFGRKLRGNPAAVVLLDEFGSDGQLQERADEFNLSETAFVVRRGGEEFDLRWFTPQTEVDLCGHATLAATAALFDARKLDVGQTARFFTRRGMLKALAHNEKIELDFPIQTVEECEMPIELARMFGFNPNGRTETCFRAGDDWLICVHQALLENARPDFAALVQLDARGVILTSQLEWPDDEIDFLSRFFAPRVGINEDPVTGSAHCALAPFWSARLNKTRMKAVQLSPRGGLLEVEVRGERVALSGQFEVRAQGFLR